MHSATPIGGSTANEDTGSDDCWTETRSMGFNFNFGAERTPTPTTRGYRERGHPSAPGDGQP
jgi:hypothetical protein